MAGVDGDEPEDASLLLDNDIVRGSCSCGFGLGEITVRSGRVSIAMTR